MTEKERFEALLKRQPVDRVPFNLFALAYCSVNVGDPKLVWFDPEKSFKAMWRTHEMYGGWHWIFFTPGRFGIREFGGETKMPAGLQ